MHRTEHWAFDWEIDDMVSIRKILVDIDAAAIPHPALEAAVKLARRLSAALKIVDVVPELPWISRALGSESIERDLVSYRQDRLATMAACLTSEGLSVETGVLRGRPALAIVREVIDSGHDLVVRSHDTVGWPDKGKQFGAIDMHLLRLCPTPVWLVDARAGSAPRRVLIAMNADPADAAERDINLHIADVTAALVRPDATEMTLLQAWTPFGEQLVRSRMQKTELSAYVETARTRAVEGVRALLPEVRGRLGEVGVEVIQGDPATAISQFAEERSVDLVVMGSVARAGIQGLVMGNTAESVLQRLRCSVLVIKPKGFRSPMHVEA
jgi:nucleotide-binding universal stress UspA family protein